MGHNYNKISLSSFLHAQNGSKTVQCTMRLNINRRSTYHTNISSPGNFRFCKYYLMVIFCTQKVINLCQEHECLSQKWECRKHSKVGTSRDFLTGSPLINQLRFAGGLLCQDVQVAVIPSPGSYCSLTPVIRGWSSGKSKNKFKKLENQVSALLNKIWQQGINQVKLSKDLSSSVRNFVQTTM